MKIDIHFRGMDSDPEFSAHINRRLSFAFSRFQHEVESVWITIADINGPTGGIDMQCRVVINAQGLNPIVITEKQDNLRQAIDRSLYRASQSLNRKLKKRRTLFCKPAPPESLLQLQP